MAYVIPAKESTYISKYIQQTPDQYLNISGFRIHYLEQGQGDPIILIHGGGSWLYSYQKNIESLAKTHLVYALDMPGHGYTVSTENKDYDLDTYADFIYDFMKEKKKDKATIIGHSWGGGWSLYFTEKYPDSVEKLVLLAPSGLNEPDRSEWKYLKYPLVGEIISKAINLKNTKESLKNMVVSHNMITNEYVDELYGAISIRENRRCQYLAERQLNWRLTEAGINEIKQPVLLIFGSEDCYFNTSYQEKMKSSFQNVTFEVIEQAGHLVHEEKSEEVNTFILNFLE